MAPHRIHLDDPPEPFDRGSTITIVGDEAKHAARVKRLEEGARVELLPGDGRVGVGAVRAIGKGKDGWTLDVGIELVRRVEPVRPTLEIWSSPPKGSRLEQMVDQLAQIGVAAWAPLSAERTVVDPREGKLERLDRIASEASKQCGRAWRLRIGPGGGIDRALGDDLPVVAGDATGVAYHDERVASADRVRLLIGPEGDWSDAERTRFDALDIPRVAFGPHVMRIETAAVAIASVVMHRS
ncbi:MAG: RsmE family RNA methyltransferase [Planctomycetota bacterium]